MSMLNIEKENVLTQILAGGKGTRLLKETKGLIPKSLVKVTEKDTIIDIVIDETKKQGLNRIVYTLGLTDGCFGIDIYKHIIQKCGAIECLFENYGSGNAISIQRLAKATDCMYPLFVLCSDMLLPWDVMKKAATIHQKGTFTWVTSSTYVPEMNKYFGLKVRSDGTVVYDTRVTPEGKYLDDGSLISVTKGGALIVDPYLLINVVDNLKKTSDSNKEIDIFWDVMPYLERLNWKRLSNGEPSIINTVIGKDPVMDIGTPEGLYVVREYLKNEN